MTTELLPRHVLLETGFSVVRSSDIIRPLAKIQPTGGTALRDALVADIKKVGKLTKYLALTDIGERWTVAQVVVTDGEDTSSRSRWEDVRTALACREVCGAVETRPTTVICVDEWRYCHKPAAVTQLLEHAEALQVVVRRVPARQLFAELLQACSCLTSEYSALALSLDISHSASYFPLLRDAVSELLPRLPPSSLISVTCFNGNVMALNYAEFGYKLTSGEVPKEELTPEEAAEVCGLKQCAESCKPERCCLM